MLNVTTTQFFLPHYSLKTEQETCKYLYVIDAASVSHLIATVYFKRTNDNE